MQNIEYDIFALTKQDTAVLKGIAIIAMLMHHLWGCPSEGVEPYTGALGFLGNVGKVCVAMFLFCSGYGLSVGYEKESGLRNTLKFLAKRLLKFYANYWVIFLVFVPITIFCFDRPLSEAYGESVNIPKRLLYDLLGVQGFQSYNITWWFNKLIIVFYFLFPILYSCIRKFKWTTLFLSFCVLFLDLLVSDFGYLPFIVEYMFPFVVGISLYQYRANLLLFSQWLQQHFMCGIFVSFVLLCCGVAIRECSIIPHFSGLRVDALLTISIVMFVVACQQKTIFFNRFFVFAGTHSANIYLIHTFFNGYWPTVDILHSERMVVGGDLVLLLALSIGSSILIEYLKSVSKYNSVINKITSKL